MRFSELFSSYSTLTFIGLTTLKFTYAQVVETSVTNNSSFQTYPHPDDHTIRPSDTPGFKSFTILKFIANRPLWSSV